MIDTGKTRVSGSVLLILSYGAAETDPDYVVRLEDIKGFYDTAKSLGFADDAILDDCTLVLTLDTPTLYPTLDGSSTAERYDIVLSHKDAIDI